MSTAETTSEVIDGLDGTVAVSKILDCTPQCVSGYRRRDEFPPHTFKPLAAEMIERDMRASLKLWRSIPSDAIELAARLG